MLGEAHSRILDALLRLLFCCLTFCVHAAELELVICPDSESFSPRNQVQDEVVFSPCDFSINYLSSVMASFAWQALQHKSVNKVVVRFLPGKYFFTKTFQLNWGIGATADIPLFIIGSGASTIFSGALPIKGWREPDANTLPVTATQMISKIQSADISDFPLYFEKPMPPRGYGLPIRPVLTDIYQNDQALLAARWPNEGYARVERPADLSPEDRRTFWVVERTGLEWRNETDLMAHAFWFHDWAAQRYPVTVGKDGRMVIDGDGSPYGILGGQRIQIENALSELDAPGEWYLQRSTGLLFAWLLDENAPAEVTVAESIFQIENSRNVVVRNLAIEKVRGDAVRVKGSENIVFDNVSIRHTGNRALVIEGGRRNGIRNSLIEHNGEGGVFLSGGDRANLIPAGHFVENSTIRDFSRLSKTYRFAVELDGVGQHVEGNKISEAPHTAIFFLGNDHKILNNEIFDVVQETSDAGAIYVGRDFTARGTVIEGNFFHDIKAGEPRHEVKGIYLDDQASGITIRNNIFARVQQPVFIGGGRDNVVENNVFYESSPGVHLDARGLNWQRTATFDPKNTLQKRLDAVPFQSTLWRKRYPNLSNIREDDFGAPKYNKVCGNIVVKGKPYSVAKEALTGIALQGFEVADESIFENPPPPNGRKARADFVLRSVVLERCATQSGDWK